MGASWHDEVEGSKGRCFPNAWSQDKTVGKPFGCGVVCQVMIWSQTSDVLNIPGHYLCPVQCSSSRMLMGFAKEVASDFKAWDADIPPWVQQTASLKMLK